jgi:putative transposase
LKETKIVFKKWLGSFRFFYNLALDWLNKNPAERVSWMDLRNILFKDAPVWSKEIPYQIKSIAVKEAHSCLVKCRMATKKTGVPQVPKFKSKKAPVHSCYIPKSAISDKGIYQRLSGVLRYSEAIPNSPMDSRLIYQQGRWFVCMPEQVTTTPAENQGRIVALDPGARTFLTGYSPAGVFKIGLGAMSRITRLCIYLDDLISRQTKCTAKQRYRFKKAADRMRWKIKDLIDELHNKAVAMLVNNFDVIVLPPFEVSNMVCKAARKLRKKSVRQMLTLSHYKFSQKLLNKAKELGKVVIRQCEAYTSKTASWTGEVVQNLGGRKTIKSLGQSMCRDINGARGIFLRALADQPLFAEMRACIVNNN